jgi:DNA-directed RNA polymerase subunit H (RpoH/RPB5)
MSKQQVLNALSTIKTMCDDRGFSSEGIAEDSYVEATVFAFDVEEGNTRVIFNLEQKFKMQSIKNQIAADKNIILVHRDTSAVIKTKDKDNIVDPGLSFTIFTLQELQYNPTIHQETPRHVLIRDPEAIKLLTEKYNVNITKFPRIHTTDRIVRHLGGIQGDVIKVYRNSDSNGQCVHFSYVTNAIVK